MCLDMFMYCFLCGSYRDSENYEVFLPTRLQKLIDEAQAIEYHLQQQKDNAMKRLLAVSKVLKLQD